jgi:hypothetical protein
MHIRVYSHSLGVFENTNTQTGMCNTFVLSEWAREPHAIMNVRIITFMETFNLQCFLHTKNESQSVISTWREKRMGAPTLTAAKPRLSVADSSPGWGLGEGEPSYTPVSPDPA